MACRTGCKTQDHASWGECARQADLQIDRHALSYSRLAEKDKEKRLGEYETLRNQGYQPKSTNWRHVRDTYEMGGVKPTEITTPAPTPEVTDGG